MIQHLPFGAGAWWFILAYLLSMIIIGWIGYKARRANTLKDFYLGGQGFGLLVLLFTLYATQYSGNTLFGYTGKTYRIGYAWIMCLHFMTAIIACYLLFAPRLYWRAKRFAYITPIDYLDDRFGSRALNILAVIIMIVVVSNYLLAQLMAMGRAMQGLSQVNPQQAYIFGVILLTLIMLIYGTLGGVRAVAWTDMIQGVVLMLGFLALLWLLFDQYGPLSLATEKLLTSTSIETVAKAKPPPADRIREWLSYLLLVGLGAALYPQAIQRIYAARSARVLRQSLAIMAFLPLTTVLVAVIAGIYAIAYIPGLEGVSSDQILTRMLVEVQQRSQLGYVLVIVLFAAILAAMMSTADSALLSISSMLSKDVYGRFINPSAEQYTLTRIGKICSWVLICFLVWLAIYLSDKASLLQLLDRKFDLLVQCVPAFMLGLHWRGLATLPVVTGLAVGVIISLTLAFGGFDFVAGGKIYGFHAGIYGLVANLFIAVGGSLLSNAFRSP